MPALLGLLLPGLIPILGPVFGDAVRSVVGWFTGQAPAEPKTVAEAIQLKDAETRQMEAVAKLDQPAGEISKWVANLRASSRYLACDLIVLGGIPMVYAVLFIPGIDLMRLDFIQFYLTGLCGPALSFLVGSRIQVAIATRKK